MFEAEIQNAHMCFRHQAVQFGMGLNAVKVTAVCEKGPGNGDDENCPTITEL